jgi:hypothetical protein
VALAARSSPADPWGTSLIDATGPLTVISTERTTPAVVYLLDLRLADPAAAPAFADYLSESRTCATGQADLHRLRHDVAAGRLSDYSLVIPNSCHDMHGAPACRSGGVTPGDSWLHHWLPRILGGADYRAGHLVVIITWDEGSATDNHIPTLVISPHTSGMVSPAPYNHCSTLRTVEDLLHLPALGCARTAASMVSTFHLMT